MGARCPGEHSSGPRDGERDRESRQHRQNSITRVLRKSEVIHHHHKSNMFVVLNLEIYSREWWCVKHSYYQCCLSNTRRRGSRSLCPLLWKRREPNCAICLPASQAISIRKGPALFAHMSCYLVVCHSAVWCIVIEVGHWDPFYFLPCLAHKCSNVSDILQILFAGGPPGPPINTGMLVKS